MTSDAPTLSTERHTPGPWFVRDPHPNHCTFNIGPTADGDYEDEVTVVYRTHDEPVHEANARLIAAAPDLLAALKGLFEGGFIEAGAKGFNQWSMTLDDRLVPCRAAIAKAEGRSADPIGDKLRSLPVVGVINVDNPHDPRHKEWKL
jgi:hypothetical protein